MKKALCLMVVGLVATSLPNASARTARTAQYTGFGGAAGTGGTFSGQGMTLGGAEFVAGSRHRFVEVDIEDQSGLPVAGSVRIDRDGDGIPDLWREICNGTSKPVPVTPGAIVRVLIFEGPCEDGTPAAATSGTIYAYFVRR